MLTVTTDPDAIDVDRVHRWLSTDAYWALGRPREVLEAAIRGSIVVSAHRDGVQVGVARVVTDAATFAWLCDVYVDREVRGEGVGRALVEAAIETVRPFGLVRMLLTTADAHDLYASYGFEPADASRTMALADPSRPRPRSSP